MPIEKIAEGSGASNPDVRKKLNEVIDLLNEITASAATSADAEVNELAEDLAALYDAPGTNQVA